MNWLQIRLFGPYLSSFSTNSYGYYSQMSQNLCSNGQIFASALKVQQAARRSKMLQDRLNAMSAASAEKLPPEIMAKMLQAKDDLGNSDILQRAIKVGEQFPDFNLSDAKGNMVHSKELRQDGPLLIALFRGVW